MQLPSTVTGHIIKYKRGAETISRLWTGTGQHHLLDLCPSEWLRQQHQNNFSEISDITVVGDATNEHVPAARMVLIVRQPVASARASHV
jgi:hypothetical protein